MLTVQWGSTSLAQLSPHGLPELWVQGICIRPCCIELFHQASSAHHLVPGRLYRRSRHQRQHLCKAGNRRKAPYGS